MSNIKVPHKFNVLLDESYRYYVFKGGRGSGKSHSIARYLIARAIADKIKILCVRELQNSITESVYTLLKDIIIEHDLSGYFNIYRNSIEGVNGSMFIFKGLAHNIESVKSTEGVDLVWIEEADKVSQNSWDILIPTIRKHNSKFIINYNPTNDDDPVHAMFVKQNNPDSVVVTVNWQDNPWFPEVLRKEMEHMKATNYEKYLHVWEGELRTISDAQIFKGKYSVCDFTPATDIECYYYGMDFGFADDPLAIVRSYIIGRTLYIDREVYAYHIDINDIPALIRNIMSDMEYNNWPIGADCSRPETISYLRNRGYNVFAAKKWQGSVEDGIEFLKSFDHIYVHASCTNVAEEFRRYSYKIDKRTNNILPIPTDSYNHCIAEGMLITTNKGDIPIEQIKVGDFVRTRSGFNRVLFAGLTDKNRKVLTIKTSCGNTVKCTPEHRIWTQKGFVRADTLRYGYKILTIKSGVKKCSKKKQLNTMVKLITVIQNQIEELTRYTSKKSQNIYTEKYGKIIMVKYRLVIMYIILMVIRPIIISITFVFYLLKNITKNIQLKTLKKTKNTSKELDRCLKHGTVHQKVLKNIVKSEQWHIKSSFRYLKYAVCAVKNLCQKPLEIGMFNVQIIANQNGEDCKELTTSKRNVSSVIRYLKQISLNQMNVVQSTVLSVCDTNEISKSVYDLTVENEHEFFAGNILVHNCVDALRYSLDGMIKNRASIYDDGVIE